jgi:hypothetical protein
MATWDHGPTSYVDASQDPAMAVQFQRTHKATRLLRQLAPALAALDLQRRRKAVGVFTLRAVDTGGLEIRADFIAAVPSAHLQQARSISVGILDDET